MENEARRIAHDLNNVAFVIMGYGHRLKELLPAADPLRDEVAEILNAVQRLADLVPQVRALGEHVPAHPRQPRILLIEDETAIRELLRSILTRRGYHVDTGCSGDEGLALCETLEPPDLLITDLILPGVSGRVIADRLRQRAPNVKVLLMSGYAEHPLLESAQAAGMPCLVKPFDMTQFNDAVQQLIGKAA